MIGDLTTIPRDQKIALIARAMAVETQRRSSGAPISTPAQRWARQFAGRPTAFIAELMPAWLGQDWLAWRTFVKVLFGEDLDAAELAIYQRCSGLQEPPGRLQRQAFVPVGRRGGKSKALSFVATHLAACYDWTPHLSPGEMGYIIVLADQLKHAASIMGYVKANFGEHPQLRSLIKRPLVESIEVEGKVQIEIVTASIKAVRSRTVIAAMLDEIAFWEPDETSANPDVEIINALRPAMLTIPNSMQIAASSRYARKGVLWNAYRDHYGQPTGPLVWSADTVTMHPSVDRDEIAAEYERDPVAAAAEYGEEWRSDVASFIEKEMVDAITPAGVYEIAPIAKTVQYQAFCDPSGGTQDSMTLAIAHLEDNIGVLDKVVERRAPFSSEAVVEEFSQIMAEYGVYLVEGDRYAGVWPADQFAKRGVQYNVTERRKSDIYQAFLPLMTSQRVRLLDVTRLRMQILGLERRVARGGRDSIDHPPGAHDDVANAAAGVLVMVAGDERMNVINRYLGV